MSQRFYIKKWAQVPVILAVLASTGCKKLVETSAPFTSINASNVYTSDVTASAVLTAIYTQLSNISASGTGIESMAFIDGLSADELTLFKGVTNPQQIACYKNGLSAQTTMDVWSNIYPYVAKTNDAINGITASTTLTLAVKQELLGEARFLRAFFYFYLVNLYGDVPLVLSTDYTKTAIVPRTPMAQVYQQIIADLKEAQSLLNSNYVDASVTANTIERTRPNKWAATAMLARVYLYTSDYVNAEAQASSIISESGTYQLAALNQVFLKNSSETIWQLQPVVARYNTQDARLFVLPASGPSSGINPVYLSNVLLSTFEPKDMRRKIWIDSVITPGGLTYYFPYKYKVNKPDPNITSTDALTEYSMVLRLAEQYLIRAEARTMEGNITGLGALADLNVIRERAGLGDYSGLQDKNSVLDAILHERQVELFTEWGHRWLDLKRTKKVDAIMQNITLQKGGVWQTTAQYFPIVQAQLIKNPDLAQTPGYN